jgi:hypothetical protein
VAIAVDWDNRTDTVTVGGKTFGRSNDSVFVMIRDHGDILSPTQLPSPTADVGNDEALRYIQRQISNNTVITAIRLLQRD